VDDVRRLRVRVGGVAGSVQLQRAEWQATKSREEEQRREETSGDKSILRALQAAPRFYEGLPACPPATASTHSTPAIPPAPPLPGREQARPRGQLAFLSLAAARAPQCTANHGAMTRRGWARGALVGASGGGHGCCCRRRGGVGLPGWLSSSWLKLDPVLPRLACPLSPRPSHPLPQPGHQHRTLRYASTTRRCYSHTLPNMEIMYKRSPPLHKNQEFQECCHPTPCLPCTSIEHLERQMNQYVPSCSCPLKTKGILRCCIRLARCYTITFASKLTGIGEAGFPCRLRRQLLRWLHSEPDRWCGARLLRHQRLR
jgi:hypothetical protein